MGDKYPGAEVIGIDLSPIQSSWVPPNVRFFIDDAEADWTDSENSLDYVHLRHMGMAIKDWPRALRQAYSYVSHAEIACEYFFTDLRSQNTQARWLDRIPGPAAGNLM